MTIKKRKKEPAKTEALPIITCPTEISVKARAEWDRVIAELNELGIITTLDRAMLTSYCVAYTLYIEAVEAIQNYGMMMKSPNGYPQQSPYVSIMNKQFEIMMRVATDFGFTPASRDRLAKPTTSGLLPLEPWPSDEEN